MNWREALVLSEEGKEVASSENVDGSAEDTEAYVGLADGDADGDTDEAAAGLEEAPVPKGTACL